MLGWICIVLALIGLGLFWRQRALSGMIEEMARAAEDRRNFLFSRKGQRMGEFGLERLQRALNDLIGEAHAASRQESGHRQIESTLRAIREAVLLIDEDNYVRMANDALLQLLDLEGPLVGRRLEGLIQSAGFLDYVYGVKTGQKTAPETIELVRNDETLHFEVHGGLLPEAEEAEKLTLFVLHDITHQVRLEKVRTEFVANVSHELRTPVTIIKGFADTMVEDFEDLTPEEQERFLHKIQKNVARLNNLLEDLLTLSRLEAKADALHREQLSLGDLIREVGENFQTRLDAQTQKLELNLTTEDDTLHFDPIRITQVLENLLDNALRHAKGFSALLITTQRLENGITCRIEDDGCGIPEGDLPHIFERFYRVDKGRSRESGGTGLGLSIVKHIIQQHGGSIQAENKPEGGCFIQFYIPFRPALQGARATDPSTPNPFAERPKEAAQTRT